MVDYPSVFRAILTPMKVNDRVRTPMPVNAPNVAKSQRYTTQAGIVTAIRGELVEVTMDKSGMKITWTLASLMEANS